MKIKLINVAEYDLKDDKVTSVDFSTMKNLCGYDPEHKTSAPLPKARLFKTAQAFKEALEEEKETEFDQTLPVKILQNGQMIVFLNNDIETSGKKTKPDMHKKEIESNGNTE